MRPISSAGYVTAVLRLLQAYNAGDLDACVKSLDSDIEWSTAVDHKGKDDVKAMLEAFRARFSEPRARPDDFRESHGNVLMVVCFHDGDRSAPPAEQRQSWIVTLNEEGLIRRVIVYPSPAEAARAFEALAAAAPKVHA